MATGEPRREPSSNPRSRDAGLGRVRRVTGSIAAGAVGGIGVLAAASAHAQSGTAAGQTVSTPAPSSSSTGSGQPSTGSGSAGDDYGYSNSYGSYSSSGSTYSTLSPPAESPRSSSRSGGGAVSGGS